MGGFLGAILRHIISLIDTGSGKFPLNTLLINLVGSIIIGFLSEYALIHHNSHPNLHMFLKTGFCGGFTTYSTFALEYSELMQHGEKGLGFLYIGLSLFLCLIGIFLGEFIAKKTI